MVRSTVVEVVRSGLRSLGFDDGEEAEDEAETASAEESEEEADPPAYPDLRAAADRLRYSPERDDADLAAVVDALDHEDAEARVLAAKALAGLPAEERGRAADALPTLVALLGDEDESVRRHAAAAVGRIGEAAPEAARECAPELADALTAHSARVCEGAGRALRAVAAVDPDAVVPLVVEYVDPAVRVITRERAVAALAAAAETDPAAIDPALEDLIELLERDTNDRARVVAALAAAADRSPGRIAPAGGALVRAAREGDRDEREDAVAALTAIATADAEVYAVGETAALLTGYLADPDPERPGAAVDALVEIVERHPDERETVLGVLDRAEGDAALRAARRLVAGNETAEDLARTALADSPLARYLDASTPTVEEAGE